MGAKATFNSVTRIITLTETPTVTGGENVVNLNVKVDLYSDGKEDWLASETLRKLRFPITGIGGQSRPGGFLGSSFFIASDWKIQPFNSSHRLLIDGNFYSEDGTSPFLNVTGETVKIEQNLSAIVEAVGVLSALEVRNALTLAADNTPEAGSIDSKIDNTFASVWASSS